MRQYAADSVAPFRERSTDMGVNTPLASIDSGTRLPHPPQPQATINPWAGQAGPQNPYLGDYQHAQDSLLNNAQGMQRNIDNMNSQLKSNYPAYPNSYGLGGQMGADAGAIPGAASNPNYLTKPLNGAESDSGSRGFNPWSLTGEANARDGQ